MDLNDLQHKLNLAKTLQDLQADIDDDLRELSTENISGFGYEYERYKDKKEALSIVILDYLNSADEIATALIEKELKANANNKG